MAVGVSLSGEKIQLALAQADQKAKNFGSELDMGPVGQRWRPFIQALRMPSVPKTYTAVFAVTLAARSLHDSSVLNVREIKSQTSEKGYAASSIGSQLARFAKAHNIDLRATSQQPLNNQPFTYKERILSSPEEMNVIDRARDAWKTFIKAVDAVDAATPSEAADALALMFHLSRRQKWASSAVGAVLAAEDLTALDGLLDAASAFVGEHPDNGRTGQAFVAAVLDLVYGAEHVLLGKVNDPDASTVGDVHATSDGEVWLWVEVKQKVVTNGEVTGFVSKVAQQGGSRAIFCAFLNSSYPDYVQQQKALDAARKKGVMLEFFDTPYSFLNHYFRVAPGSSSEAASRFIGALVNRVAEAACPQSTIDALQALLDQHGVELERHEATE